MLTQEILKSFLHYDPDTGIFTWLKKPCRRICVGDAASNPNPHGYIRIGILGERYLAHRLAWLYMTGRWPENDVDHTNGKHGDNRFANLRDATRSQNLMNSGKHSNNTSGHKGVLWDKKKSRWLARAQLHGKVHFLGYFQDAADAAKSYAAFADQHHGEFKHQGDAQ